jgi:dihydrofolate synthase / folylpolyglutamate synthase
MSYSSAIDQLNAMTPELFTQPGQARRKFSLEEIGTLLNALGNPHWHFPSILIAGTNGKGSTASTLASILAASGLRTGLYTSPHLTRPNERIRISGVEISDEAFADTFFRVHRCAEQLVSTGKLAQLPSFFEHLTAMAFLHFADGAPTGKSSAPGQNVAIAVLEVGMGGRLDATNIVDPLLSVITDISLDHTEWLGPTIAAITREKAGILRRNGTLITLPQHSEANEVIGEVATELGVRAISAVPYMPQTQAASDDTWHDAYYVQALGTAIEVASPLHGEHQHRNIALAITAAVELAFHHGVPITPASIANGVRNTSWPGRLESIQTPSETGAPTRWILDVAHNPAGAWALRAGLRRLAADGCHMTLIFSCLRDKPVAEMAQILFPIFDHVIFAPIHSIRATPMQDLLAAAASTGTPATVAASVEEALALAEQSAGVKERQEERRSTNEGAPFMASAGRTTWVGKHEPTNPTSVILSDRSEAKGVEGPASLAATSTTKTGAPTPGSPSTGPSRWGGGLESETWESTNPKSANNKDGASAPEREAPPAPKVIVVSGSVYLVGEARPLLLARAEAPIAERPK